MMESFRKRTERFWAMFVQAEATLREALDEHQEDEAEQRFQALFSRCLFHCPCWLRKQEGHYLCIVSSQGDKLKYLFLHYVMERAPHACLVHWRFHDALPKGIRTKGILDDTDERSTQLLLLPHSLRQRFHLDVYAPFETMKKAEKIKLIHRCLDDAVGEYVRMFLIGQMKLVKQPPQAGISLADFSALCERETWVKRQRHAHQIFSTYAIFPNQQEYLMRSDIFSGVSSQLEVITDYIRGKDQRIRQAKEYGIVVGFLFYEHAHLEQSQRLWIRENLEETIAQICVKDGIAENIGAANGLMYTYLDYVVYDWEAFVKAALAVMEDIDTHLYGFQSLIHNELPLHLVDNRPQGMS